MTAQRRSRRLEKLKLPRNYDSLLDLPSDILQLIFDSIDLTTDTPSLLLICKPLLPFSISHFFRKITIHEESQLDRFFHFILKDPALGRFVRSLDVDSNMFPSRSGQSIESETIRKVLSRLSNLEDLRIIRRDDIIAAILDDKDDGDDCSYSLRSVELSGDLGTSSNGPFDLEAFTNFANRPNLASLSLIDVSPSHRTRAQNGTPSSAAPAVDFSDTRSSSIRHLSLMANFADCSRSLEFLSRFHKLQSLTLTDLGTRSSLPSLLNVVTRPELVNSLKLIPFESGPLLSDHIGPSLERYVNLETFEYNFSQDTKESFFDTLRLLPLKRLIDARTTTARGFSVDRYLTSLVKSETRHRTLEMYEARGIESKVGTFIDFKTYLEETDWIIHMDDECERMNEDLTDWLGEIKDEADKSGIKTCGTSFDVIEVHRRWLIALDKVKNKAREQGYEWSTPEPESD